MKRYIKISNRGMVNRLFLEVIGLGNKRQKKTEDGVSIGQFHSGFKLATPSALSLGLDVVISSSDSHGPFVLGFETKEINIVHNGQEIIDKLICYKYSDGNPLALPVALSAFPDWGKPLGDDSSNFYNIFREYIANARDEDVDFTIEEAVTDIVQAPAGRTALYIEENGEILELLRNSAPYFKFLSSSPPIFNAPGTGAIYPKSTPGFIRLFNQGYLVSCQKEDGLLRICLYDYDAVGKELVAETRVLKNQEVFDDKIAKLFSRITDRELLERLVVFAAENIFSYEAKIFARLKKEDISAEFCVLCLDIWKKHYGENALLASGDAVWDIEAKNLLRCSVVKPGHHMVDFFKQLGILDAKEALRMLLDTMKFRNLTPEENQRVEDIISDYLDCLDYYANIRQYNIEALESEKFRGYTANSYSTIAIATHLFKEADEGVLRTLTHEFRHCETQVSDSNFRVFMKRADEEIVYLLINIKMLADELRKMGVDPKTVSPNFIK
ncbi:MAG: hypothetical protein V1661_01195 [bacterium]